MNKTIKSIVSYVLMLMATAFLLWFSFKNIEAPAGKSKFDFIKETWQSADSFYLLLSGLLAVISHIVRAERWRLMLAPIGYPVGLLRSFFSVMVGYFVNLAIPRGGELSRCLNMFRLERVPVETSVGTVVAERVIDVVFLLSFITASFLIEYDKLVGLLSDFLAKRAAVQSTSSGISPIWFVLIFLTIGLSTLFLLIKLGKLRGITDKLKEIWLNMRKGLFSVFSLDKKGLFLFYSLFIWVLYFLMAWLVMLAFQETKVLGLEAALTVFTIGSIAMAMPLPGGAGSYHILVPAGLNLFYGLAVDKALGFTIIFHAWQTFVVIAVGLVSMIGSQFLKPAQEKNEIGG